jgi:hypothetical protein
MNVAVPRSLHSSLDTRHSASDVAPKHRMVPGFDEEGEAATEIQTEAAIDSELPQALIIERGVVAEGP